MPARRSGTPTAAIRAVAAGLATLVLAACGSPPGPPVDPPSPDDPATPAARTRLAAHAAAAKDLAGAFLYDLTTPAGDTRSVMVIRADDGTWRVDVPGAALDGRADIALARTADGLFHCALAGPAGTPTGCVAVERIVAEADPQVQRVFTDWLDVLLNRGAPLAVTTATQLSGVTGECFAIEPSAASLEPALDAGIYCYRADGVLTGARLSFGTLTLASVTEQTLPSVELPGPVIDGDPLPLESPPPPSPSASPGASPSASSAPSTT